MATPPGQKPNDRAVGGIQIRGVRADLAKQTATQDVDEILRAADDEKDPARALCRCLFVLFKNTSMYDIKNSALKAPVERTLKAVVAYLARDGVLSVQRRHDGLYVNNTHVPPDASLEDLHPYLEAIYEKLKIHEIVFTQGHDEPALRELLAHLQLVSANKHATGEHRWETVQIRELPKERAYEERRDREKVVAAYALSCVRVSEVLNAFAKGLMPSVPRLKSALTGVLDLPAAHEPVLISALAVARENPSPWGLATNCAVLVGLVGRRLGWDRARLLSSATATALHDLAANLPPGSTDPRRAVKLVLQVPGAGADLPLWVVAMTEMAAPPESRPIALARLIALVRAFELIVTGSPTRAPLTCEQALRVLSGEAGRRYDATLFALFCRTIGLLPPGTQVQLDTGELGVVAAVPTDAAKLMQPLLRIVAGPGAGTLLDLATANPPRKVVRSLSACETGVNPVRWLLG
jgi:HD-GYP domain-containing protein (c-di-GMP phosphodiesterase class II)